MPEKEHTFIPEENSTGIKVRDLREVKEEPEKVSKEIIENGFETITDPEDIRLKEIHEFFLKIFKPEEVAPLETFRAELSNEQMPVQCNILRDPQTQEIVCASWGNYMKIEGEQNKSILAGNLTATDKRYQHMNLATAIVNKRSADAEHLAEQRSEEYLGSCNEGSDSSEKFWNPRLRRIYIKESNGSLQEVYYQVPPLKWDHKTGEPLSTGITEHFQIESNNDTISSEMCLKYIKTIYKNWYFRPRDEFESNEAFENHTKKINEILKKIAKQLKGLENDLVFLTKKEREERIKGGENIGSLEDKKVD